jgi:hypothetical protein
MTNDTAGKITPMRISFRAECESDVHLFISAIRWDILEVDISAEKLKGADGYSYTYPDRDVKLVTSGNLNLEELRWVAAQIQDCHVIADTIELAEHYTGVRLYGEYAASAPIPHFHKIANGLQDYGDYLSCQLHIAKKAEWDFHIDF